MRLMLFLFDPLYHEIATTASRSLVHSPERPLVLIETKKTYPVTALDGLKIPEGLVVRLRYPDSMGELEEKLLKFLLEMGMSEQKKEVYRINLGGKIEEVEWLSINTTMDYLAKALKAEKYNIKRSLERIAMCSMSYANHGSRMSGSSALVSFVLMDGFLSLRLAWSVSRQDLRNAVPIERSGIGGLLHS